MRYLYVFLFTLLLNPPLIAVQTLLPLDPVEMPLTQIAYAIKQQDWRLAQQLNQSLHQHYPNFYLATLLAKHITSQSALPLVPPMPLKPTTDENIEPNLYAEWYLRSHYQAPQHNQPTPSPLLQIGSQNPYVVIVDSARSRLYLLAHEANTFTIVADYYIGIGKQGTGKQREGDYRTPLGIYTVEDYLPDKQLPELYGEGAYTLDYPNRWDQRQRRTGSGIWLHGVPRSTYSRPPRASRGCVTLSNALFASLKPYVQPGHTPFIISSEIEWQQTAQQQDLTKQILARLESWKQAWENLQHEDWLNHYHPKFRSNDKDLQQWSEHKKIVNARKQLIQLQLANIDIFLYPGEDDLILTRFTQRYHSNNFSSTGSKEIYWKRYDSHWLILQEATFTQQ